MEFQVDCTIFSSSQLSTLIMGGRLMHLVTFGSLVRLNQCRKSQALFFKDIKETFRK